MGNQPPELPAHPPGPSAKPRKRRRWLRWTFLAILVLLVILHWPTGQIELRVSPETTVVTGPLNPDGTVDYVAAFNAELSQGVTPENNAAVLLLRALGSRMAHSAPLGDQADDFTLDERTLGPLGLKLDELAPRYVKAIPLDIFTDKPLTYVPREDGYLLYSVGRNLRDDGGRSGTKQADDIAARIPADANEPSTRPQP